MFRPRSIRSLVLTGLTLALLPLATALVVAVIYVDRLAEQSQVAVVQAVEATQNGRLMVSQLTTMERSFRQHLVLGDASLLEVYRDGHALFRRTLDRLAQLTLNEDQQNTLSQLDEAEQALFDVFGSPNENHQDKHKVAEFLQLQDLARDFLAESSKWVDQEVARLQTLAGNATLILSWLMVSAIPAAVVLAGTFAALIVRPLRHMSEAIHRLGNEDFTIPVMVQGPHDLEELGERLEWLRVRLAELEEQKVRFLRHMSHELKTPLTSLREGAELLADGVIGTLNGEQQEVANIMRENSIHLQKLIEDLLNFNQALSRTLQLQKEPVDMVNLIEEAIEAQRLAWLARDIHIIKDLKPLCLRADREKLAIIVDNLLSNAIKFSPPESKIRISLKARKGIAQLEVHDSGPGFHPADKKHVFEAFYQGRTRGTGHVSGSGLGLAIAREYSVAHQGALEIVDNEPPGGWVRLSLPMQ